MVEKANTFVEKIPKSYNLNKLKKFSLEKIFSRCFGGFGHRIITINGVGVIFVCHILLSKNHSKYTI